MLEKILGTEWSKELIPHLSTEYFKELGNFLESEYSKDTIYPPKGNIFNAFKLTNYADINVVILGLDPYIRHGQAYGISFGILDSCLTTPPSLRNIQKEVENDVYDGLDLGFDYTLKSWCSQGCFMYNTALTVVEGKTGSHIKQWAPFTEAVIKALNNKDFCIYLLLGKIAQGYEKFIDKKENFYILKAPHPSAESYAGGNAGFFGSKVFSKINNILLNNNKLQIKW